MKKLIITTVVLLSAILVSAQESDKKNATMKSGEMNSKEINCSWKIIDAPNHTFGYDIFNEDKLIIHQPSIPAMPGNDGFKTKADAQKVAKFAITKIYKGEMPPTITIEELKTLKVVK